MASTAKQILDLKRQALALKEAGDTNGAMQLLAQARDLEFENAQLSDLWEPLKLKQFAVVMKKRGNLDAAREALIKAKQIEKGELSPNQQSTTQEAAPPAQTAQEAAPLPPAAESQAEPPTPAAPPQITTPSEPLPKNEPPEHAPVVEESGNDKNDDDELRELMQLGQPEDSPMDVAFSIEEMTDHEMMTEFKLGGMPVPTDHEYRARILECKKAALAAKKAGDTTKALQELQKSKQLEKVRVALSQMGEASADQSNELDDGWMDNLNAEESELLGELLPIKPNNGVAELANTSSSSDRIEDVLEELAGFLEDPALLMDALEMGMEVPSVEEVQAKADEQKMMAVESKKAGNMEGAKAALIKSKQLTAYALKLKGLLEHAEKKKGGGSACGAPSEVKLEDLEAMLETDEKKAKAPPTAAPKEPTKEAAPAGKTSKQLKEEAIRLRDQKNIKEAGEVLKLYKEALKREQDAAEMRRRQEFVSEIRKEIDFAQHQVRIFEYFQRFCDADTGAQQVGFWKEYATRCANVSKVIMSKGTGAIMVSRKKTNMMCARQIGADGTEDFNVLIANLVDRGTNSDPPDERLEINIVELDKIKENTNLQKLFKKQKRENLPEHPWTIRLEVHVQLPPNEHETDKSIELVYEPSSTDPLKKLELTTQENGQDSSSACMFEKSKYVDLPREKSAYGKILKRRVERNKKIQICAYHDPVAEKKGWLWSKKNKEELPPPTLLGKVVLEMQDLMTKKCLAAGTFPLMNGSGTKELGGILKLMVRTGVPFTHPEEQDEAGDADPICTKVEQYTAMVFSLNKEQPSSTAAEI